MHAGDQQQSLKAKGPTTGRSDAEAALGFARTEIDAANSFCCGAMTLEGAPHLMA